MKILHIISGGETGGSKKHLLQLFHKAPFTGELLLLTEGQFAEDARRLGIKVNVFPQKNRLDRSTSKKVLEYIRGNGFSLVHSHGARANFLVNSICNKLNIAWAVTVHSDPSLDFLHQPKILNRIFTYLNKKALRNADHLFAVSEKFKKMLMDYGIPEKRITSVFNGIEFHESLPAYNSKAIRKKLDTEETDFVYAIVARLHPVKGHELLFNTFSKLPDSNWKLWVIGDGALRESLEDQVEKLKLKDHIQFLGTRNDVNQLLFAADISLLTSYSESFPLVLLESADMGTPVIATDVGGVSDLIVSKETGWIVPPGDEEALLKAALEAKETDTGTMGNKLRHFSIENFSNAQLQKQLFSSYQQITDSFTK